MRLREGQAAALTGIDPLSLNKNDPPTFWVMNAISNQQEILSEIMSRCAETISV
jgi:hypothetical protein